MMDALSIEAAEAAVACGYPEGAGAVLARRARRAGRRGRGRAGDRRFGSCEKAGATEIRTADDPEERGRDLDRAASPRSRAVGRLSPAYIVQDGVVPRTALGDVLARISALSAGGRDPGRERLPRRGRQPAPAGAVRRRRAAARRRRAEELSGAILDTCIEYGGSITGEHGVGIDKSKYMPKMFSPADLDTMQLVRCAFDPANLCNPGKIFPTPRLCGEVPGPRRGAAPRRGCGQAEIF